MKKKTKTPFKGYTDEQLAYFQAMNDMDDGLTDDIQDVDYVDYLMGDVNNPHEGTTMDTEFDELGDDSDWFMD